MDGIVVGQGRYILGRQIGSGSFGRIYSGENMRYCSSTLSGTCIETDTQYAVKMEKKATKVPQLKHEAKIIEKMQDEGCPETTCAVKCAGGFPQLLWVGDDEEGEHTVVVMQLLGASIEDLFEFCAKKLTLKTVLMLVDQMVQKTVALLSQTLQLERLETLHSRGIFHRDIKPDNFLVGHGEDGGTLYIIDFGLAKQWRHPKTRAHVAERSGSKRDLVGTARYASCNAHLGLDLSRRDDLESLGYVFVYLATGGLPWQGIRGGETAKDKYEKIGQKKMTTSLEELCRGLPRAPGCGCINSLAAAAFQAYLTYCKALAFDQDPDYDYMRSLFRQLFEQERFHYDFIFDWTVLSSRGQLRVTVEEARDLLGKDRGKSSDPYVTLQLGKSQRDKTAVINRNLNPEWHESFTFEITDPTAILSLHIWNKNSMKKDQFLGRVELPVATLEHGVTTDSWHVLQKRSAKSHVAGEVRLTLAYHAKAPLEETAGAEPPEKPSSEEQPASATPDGAAERQSDDGQGGPAEAGSKEDGEQVAEGPANAEAASAASSFDSCALAEVFSNVTDDLDVFTPVGDGDGREEGEEGESRSDGKTPTPAEGAAATQETSAEEVPAAKE